MKTLFHTLLALTLSVSAFAGQIGPYSYTYGTTPVSAPVTAINPPPGSTVIATDTGTYYRKVGALGDNSASAYAVDAVQLITTSTPLTGATVTASNAKADETVIITPAGTIAALTFVFPSDTNSRIGQQITLQSSQIVTTLTLTKGGQTITDPAGTALAANVPQRWIKTAASTWVRMSNVATDSGVVLTASVITNGLTASGSAANDFSASTGTFLTSSGTNTFSGTGVIAANKSWSVTAGTTAFDLSNGTGVFKSTTGANTLSGAVTVNDATTPSITLASGKTNTGFVTINGKTSGGLKFIAADSAAQTVTVSLAAQTTGAATLSIADQGGVASTISSCSTATLTAGATPAFAPGSNISTYLLTPAQDETIAATTTGAVAGKTYHIRVLTSGTSTYTLTFGSNFKSTGTLATGATSAKTFVVSFLFDGSNFVEVARTTAM